MSRIAARRSIVPVARDRRSFAIGDVHPTLGYVSAALGGEAGVSSGFGAALLASPRKLPTSAARLAGRTNNANAGWLNYGFSNQTLSGQMFLANGNNVLSQPFTFQPTDINKLFLVVLYYDGAGFLHEFHNRGVELVTAAQAATAMASYQPYVDATNAKQYFGNTQLNDGAGPRDLWALFSLLTFRTNALTSLHIRDLADRTRQLGDLPQTWSGVPVTHRWSVRDNYQRSKPTIGRTINLAKNFISDTNSFQATTGLRGSTTGWWLAYAWVPYALTGSKRLYYNLSGASQGSFSGLSIIQSAGRVGVELIDNTGTYAGAQLFFDMLPGDLFKPQLLIVTYDGTQVRLYWRRSLVGGAGVARTYAPAVAAARVGRADTSAKEPMPVIGWLGMMGSDAHSLTANEAAQIYDDFRAVGYLRAFAGKTQKLWNVHQDVIDSGNNTVPVFIQERMGTGDVFVALNGAGSFLADVVVDDGIVAPVALPDTITAAAGDRLEAQGDNSVLIYDPRDYDSKSTIYGVSGVTSTNYLATAASKGLRGSTSGFWLHYYGRLDAFLTTYAMLVSTTQTGSGSGYQLYFLLDQAQNQGQLFFGTVATSQYVQAGTSPGVVAAADLGTPQQIQCVYDGATLSLYYKRRLVASIACSGYVASGTPMFVGNRGNGNVPAQGCAAFGLQGGDGYVPTVAELQACYDATEAAGKLQPMPGSTSNGILRTQHYYDFDADTRANNGSIPAQFWDRIGTDHLAPLSAGLTLASQGKPSLGRVQYGIQSFSDVNGYDGTGGLVGGPAFHFVWRGQFLRVPTTLQALMTCVNAAGTAGCHLQVTSVGQLRFGTGGGQFSSLYTIAASLLMQTIVIHAVFNNGRIQLFIDGVQQGADVNGGANPVNTGGTLSVGHYTTLNPPQQGATDVLCFQCGGGEYAPSMEEIARQVAASQRDNRLTGLGPTKTTHLYDFDQDLRDSGGMGTPVTSLDRVGTAHLTRAEFGVTTALNNIRGIGPVAFGDGYTGEVGRGIQGNNTAFYAGADIRLMRMPPATPQMIALIGDGGTVGWFLQAYESGGSIAVRGAFAGITYTNPVLLPSSILGQRIRIIFQRTSSTVLQLWVNGTQAADTSVSSYGVPSAYQLRLGYNAAPSVVIEALVGSTNQILTPAEISAQFADMTKPLLAVAGKTTNGWFFDRAIANNNGQLPNEVPDTIGNGGTLSRSGSGLVATSRSERMWSYEDTPIMYGAKGDYSASYSGANASGFDGSPAGWMVEIAFILLTLNVSSTIRCIAGKRLDNSNLGWDIRTSGTNSIMQLSAGNAGTTVVSPAVVFTAADVGKVLVFTGVWDGPSQMLRSHCRRQRVGIGTALATYAQSPTANFMLGGRTGANPIGPFVQLLGFRAGQFVPTVNEVAAATDHYIATEKWSPSAYPGRRFENFYRFDTSTPPATLVDMMGTTNLTHGGTPVGNDIYHRLWAA